MWLILSLNAFFLLFQHINSALPTQSSCGTQTISPSIDGSKLNRIINGESATANSWPWMVSLRVLKTDGTIGSHFCGGVLIYENIVLTAAHCLNKYKAYQMVLVIGDNTISSVTTSSSTVFFANQTKYNDNYNSQTFRNDIGLIQLTKNVTLNNNRALVCIPSGSGSVVLNKYLVLTGWGSISGVNSASALSTNLQQAKLKIINGNAQCTANGLSYDINSNYCAIGDATQYPNACFGGGPLIYYSTTDSKWYTYGITSYVAVYSTGICRNTYPSYYTQVPYYLTWIETQLNTAIWINRSTSLEVNLMLYYSIVAIFFIILIK